MKQTIFSLLMLCLTLSGIAQKKEVVILTVNDMHAAIQNFPQMAAVVDSIRDIYPQLIVFSAGDNRTGNPLNDRYKEPSYPITALMNQVGVAASAVGNHEFDSGTEGFRRQMRRSNFRYLCANVEAEDSLSLHVLPYQIFDIEGIRLGVLGVLHINSLGIPESHPKNLHGLKFHPVKETIKQYEWLKDQCDVMALLSHDGYADDIETARLFPWIDVILGGHSHTKVAANTFHSNVLVTQGGNNLKWASLVKIELENGKVTNRSSELINIYQHSSKDELVSAMVDFFSDNEELKQTVCTLETDITQEEEFGCLVADALRAESGADIALQNGGGVRLKAFAAGPFTLQDVFRLDPFGNECVMTEITGRELGDFILECYNTDLHILPYLSGVKYRLTIDAATQHASAIELYAPDGKKMNLKKKYKVATNSYVDAICHTVECQSTGEICSTHIETYLRRLGKVNYAGRRCIVRN